jgi:predicted Zn-dependent protease
MLSERPEGCEEALTLVEKALEQLGHNPEVLDTKGMILLRKHEAPKAVDTLKQATKSPNANPASYLHLSLAYRDAGNKARAREELQTYRKLKPDTARLSDEEKEQLADLESALAQ